MSKSGHIMNDRIAATLRILQAGDAKMLVEWLDNLTSLLVETRGTICNDSQLLEHLEVLQLARANFIRLMPYDAMIAPKNALTEALKQELVKDAPEKSWHAMSRQEALRLLDVMEDSHASDEEKRLAIARLSELICILLPE